MKTCSKCQKTLPLADFPKSKNARCRSCLSQIVREYRYKRRGWRTEPMTHEEFRQKYTTLVTATASAFLTDFGYLEEIAKGESK